MFDLNGKTALVTGSSQGIGYAVAFLLAKQGAKVFVHGSDEEKCVNAAKTIAGSTPLAVDLSAPDAADRIYEKTGNVDILICNASVQFRNPWNCITKEEMDLQFQVNVASTLALIQKYVPYMKEQGYGRIVTVGSVQQTNPHKDMAIYAATKCAQMSLVENLAKQLAPFGITVNNLSPGVIATPRNEAALSDKKYEQKVLAGIPCGYAGLAEDCAPPMLLLVSEEGRYITGTDLVVDGGMHL